MAYRVISQTLVSSRGIAKESFVSHFATVTTGGGGGSKGGGGKGGKPKSFSTQVTAPSAAFVVSTSTTDTEESFVAEDETSDVSVTQLKMKIDEVPYSSKTRPRAVQPKLAADNDEANAEESVDADEDLQVLHSIDDILGW